MESTPDFVLPTSSRVLTEEEESEQFIKDTLRSQKEFEGMDLNQVADFQKRFISADAGPTCSVAKPIAKLQNLDSWKSNCSVI